MSKRLPFLGGLVLLACLSSRSASADPIQIQFDVTVTFAHGNLEPFFGVPVAAGNVFSGSFALDPSSPDHNGASNFGFYTGEGEFRLDIGRVLTLPVVNYQVYDNAACADGRCDAFQVNSLITTFPGFDSVSAAITFLTSPDRRSGDALPRSAAEIAATYTSSQFFFSAIHPQGTSSFGGVARLRVADPHPVPEPGTWLLMGTALAAMSARRARVRRRTRSSKATAAPR